PSIIIHPLHYCHPHTRVLPPSPTRRSSDLTDVRYGDVLGNDSTVVGYECDGCAFTMIDGQPMPTFEDETPSTMEILGICPVQHRSEEHTSELQSRGHLVCRLLLEKKK